MDWIAPGLGGLVVGAGGAWLILRLYNLSIRKRAQAEADAILQEAKDDLEIQLLEEKERTLEIEEKLWGPVEAELQSAEEKLNSRFEEVEEKKSQMDNRWSQTKQKLIENSRELEEQEKALEKLRQAFQSRQHQIEQKRQQLLSRFAEQAQVQLADEKSALASKAIEEAKERARAYVEHFEDDAREHAETLAKDAMDTVIARFQRAYSSERGIAPVYFENPEQKKTFTPEVLQAVSDLTGCEVHVEEELDFVGVAGFDPVRRELTRRVLERILREKKKVDAVWVKKTGENIQRELLSQIKRDGDLVAKELKLDQLHPEIRQMMGSLRYRYSFTQNQYFHCAEVGWLCGLLAAELGTVRQSLARRSGLLHDLGKSMDHEFEGGHAVIGADFIQARGESPEVVHAVRAHHFDVQPENDMDYLVIAADAISGARPGARRSTVESYNQKVSDLDNIARSFDGVQDCFILYGGRECRVLVNGRKVDDVQALHIGQKIAQRIENELQYPGQIKVVVVRETLAVESTRGH